MHADVFCETETPYAHARFAEDVTTHIDESLQSEDATYRVKGVVERTWKISRIARRVERRQGAERTHSARAESIWFKNEFNRAPSERSIMAS